MGRVLYMNEGVGIKTLPSLVPEDPWGQEQVFRSLRHLHVPLKLPKLLHPEEPC